MSITPETTVAELVAGQPATILVFQRHHIEFCCAGQVSLATVCAHERLDVIDLIEELRTAIREVTESADWNHASLAELVDHIQQRYHEHLYQELPRLGAMMEKVYSRHGDRWPQVLGPLRASFEFLAEDLVHHMRREDAILFPAIVAAEARLTRFALPEAIGVMERDHARADELLGEMRELTVGYQPPHDVCPTFRGLYFGLADLDRRMRLHVHLENDILFPRALELA